MHFDAKGFSLLQAFTERAQAVAAHVTTVASIEAAAEVIAAANTPGKERPTATSVLLFAYPSLRGALLKKGVTLRVASR